jgi:hypothetical protein
MIVMLGKALRLLEEHNNIMNLLNRGSSKLPRKHQQFHIKRYNKEDLI